MELIKNNWTWEQHTGNCSTVELLIKVEVKASLQTKKASNAA